MVTHAQAEAFLVERFGAGVRAVCSVGHGEWSQAFTYACGGEAGGQYVIRFSPFEEDFTKDRLAAGYGSPALPIPPIVELGQAFGGFYAISPRALGSYLDALEGVQLRALLPALFNLVVSPTGFGPFEQALSRLHELIDACPEERHLVHSDLLNYNVLVSHDRLSGVIDWGCAMYGDFLYDVAWLAFWSSWYPAWQGVDFASEAARHYASIGLDVPDLHARLRSYQVHIGLGGQAYNAFKGRWPELEATARRTLEVADQSP